MNHYPHHIGDYLKDTAHLGPLEDGIYRRMLDLYYTLEGPLERDLERLCRRIRVDFKRFGKIVHAMLCEFFESVEEGWRHLRCEIEIAKYKGKADANRANGKAGGRPKRTREKPTGLSMGSDSITQNNLNQNQNQNQNQETTLRVDPPSAEKPEPPGNTAAGAMAAELRRKGVSVTSQHPTLLQWLADGFSIPSALEAVEVARLTKPVPEPLPANYVDRILRNPPKKAEPAWWSSDQRIIAKGKELDLNPRPGEEMVAFKERIQNEIGKRKQAA